MATGTSTGGVSASVLATSAPTRLSYARVCIEIDAKSKLQTEVFSCGPDGNVSAHKVEYEWKLLICTKCKYFGHVDASCSSKQAWIATNMLVGNGSAIQLGASSVLAPLVDPPVELDGAWTIVGCKRSKDGSPSARGFAPIDLSLSSSFGGMESMVNALNCPPTALLHYDKGKGQRQENSFQNPNQGALEEKDLSSRLKALAEYPRSAQPFNEIGCFDKEVEESTKMDELVTGNSMEPGKKTVIAANDKVDQKMNVYIWDMDETLILLKSLVNGTYAEAFNGSKDVKKGIEIGHMWEKHILKVCDEYLFYEQIEDYNKPFLDALSAYDDGLDLSGYDFNKDGFSPPNDDSNKRKLAYRHRFIAQKYAQGLRNVLDQEMMKLWDDLYDLTDSYTDRWLSSARAFLEQCSGGNKVSSHCLASADGVVDSADTKSLHINVLVTAGSLIPSLVKCLLFRLDNLITHENVYSSWEVGKLQCFSWIKERFSSPNVRFCVIGDGWEECEAAETLKWPFVRIDLRPGSSHRFPGLTVKTVSHYFSIIYGPADADDDEE
ncbi:hypothetical protein HHK36_028176 [Tetracentron sinense]|uniref:protein-tyrosine-phosphatase n=1 Tax=Tetracentron sinense TaxID=13715 RepID=A0A834YJG5_TETSI|nr:hypothetical protein HHK36_028176 [Tetracentron sinense]